MADDKKTDKKPAESQYNRDQAVALHRALEVRPEFIYHALEPKKLYTRAQIEAEVKKFLAREV